jgi:hypothetical protein
MDTTGPLEILRRSAQRSSGFVTKVLLNALKAMGEAKMAL